MTPKKCTGTDFYTKLTNMVSFGSDKAFSIGRVEVIGKRHSFFYVGKCTFVNGMLGG